MRAGNSITRKYFETITGVITGSSMDNKYMRNFTLFFSGFKGENYLDDNIWMYKTHVPFRPLDGVPYMQNKAIVCVRNPLDICVSAFTLRMTGGHSLNCENNISKDFPDIWSLFLKESKRKLLTTNQGQDQLTRTKTSTLTTRWSNSELLVREYSNILVMPSQLMILQTKTLLLSLSMT